MVFEMPPFLFHFKYGFFLDLHIPLGVPKSNLNVMTYARKHTHTHTHTLSLSFPQPSDLDAYQGVFDAEYRIHPIVHFIVYICKVECMPSLL